MAQKKLLLTSGLGTLAMMLVMALHGAPLKIEGVSPHGIISLELARTPFTARDIIDAWMPDLIPLAVVNTYIDFIFIAFYTTFLYSFCRVAAGWYAGHWRTLGYRLSAGMLVAGFFDVVENILMFKIMRGSLGSELVASTFMFAAVKFLLVALGIVYLVLSCVGLLAVQQKRR